jgi:hypothetical protein
MEMYIPPKKSFLVYQSTWRHSLADSNRIAGPKDDKSYDKFCFMHNFLEIHSFKFKLYLRI